MSRYMSPNRPDALTARRWFGRVEATIIPVRPL
jgi:hypothetical protein